MKGKGYKEAAFRMLILGAQAWGGPSRTLRINSPPMRLFKVKGLDLSLVGFRGTLALVDELEMVLNAAQHGTDAKPPRKRLPSISKSPSTVPNPVLLCPHVM